MRSGIAFCLLVSTFAAGPVAQAQTEANPEAAARLASGNAHVRAAETMRGSRRTRELEAALADYRRSLSLVRSRNVLFNASLACEALERYPEAYNLLLEYLEVRGLSDEEASEAEARLRALEPRVALLTIRTEPTAALWIDRRDLPSLGHSPRTYAVEPGSHRVFAEAPGFAAGEQSVQAISARSVEVQLTLRALPIRVEVRAPSGIPLFLDGRAIESGSVHEVDPGPHRALLAPQGTPPIEQRFVALANADPIVIDFHASAPPPRPTSSSLDLHVDPSAVLHVDGILYGRGMDFSLPLSPGTHRFALEARGHVGWSAVRSFEPGAVQRARIALPRTPKSLFVPRVLVGVLAGLGVLGTGIAVAGAAIENDEYRQCAAAEVVSDSCRGQYQTAFDWGIGAYTTIGITTALAIAAVVLWALDDPRAEEPKVTFRLAADSGSTSLAIAGTL